MISKTSFLVALYLCVQLAFAANGPAYEVVNKIESKVEIRKYAPSKWVSYSSSGSCQGSDLFSGASAYTTLFAYTNGANDQKKKIPNTVPFLVDVSTADNNVCVFRMRFFIPKEFQQNTPIPTGNAVLEDLPELTVATIQFGGFAQPNDYIKQTALLVQKLGANAGKYDSVNFITAGYNSPIDLFGRVNEVWFRQK